MTCHTFPAAPPAGSRGQNLLVPSSYANHEGSAPFLTAWWLLTLTIESLLLWQFVIWWLTLIRSLGCPVAVDDWALSSPNMTNCYRDPFSPSVLLLIATEIVGDMLLLLLVPHAFLFLNYWWLFSLKSRKNFKRKIRNNNNNIASTFMNDLVCRFWHNNSWWSALLDMCDQPTVTTQ